MNHVEILEKLLLEAIDYFQRNFETSVINAATDLFLVD